MRGDFLANKEYIVSKYGDRITFLQIQPDYEMFELYLPRKIVDMCLQENNLFILSDDAIHVYSLKTRILTENAVTLNSKPVSMEVNHEAMAILDTNNDIIVYSLPGKAERYIYTSIYVDKSFWLIFNRYPFTYKEITIDGNLCKIESVKLVKDFLSKDHPDSDIIDCVQLYLWYSSYVLIVGQIKYVSMYIKRMALFLHFCNK